MMMKLSGKRILVVGLARSGAAIARFLNARGAQVTVTDKAQALDLGQRPMEMEALGIATELGVHNPDSFLKTDLIVLSPGVPHTLPQIKQAMDFSVPVMGEIELASMFIKEPIIAVTGTNGKTTTTTLISLMLEESGFKVFTGGNIGNPLTEYIELETPSDLVVVELSSFQLDTIKRFRPKIAVLLNITEDHLDRYASFEAYTRSKGRIFENQEMDDIAIINGDDPTSLSMGKILQNRKYTFGAGGSGYSAVISRKKITLNLPGCDTMVLDLSQAKLMGNHNRENIAAAALATLSAGGKLESIQTVVDTFEGLPHRIQHIGTIRGIDWYNDSKATNMDAVVRALDAFDSPLILILGGRNKGGSFLALKDGILKSTRTVVAMGESAKEIKNTLSPFIKVIEAQNMEEAVALSYGEAKEGDKVLFSPACSSFDMFTNYEHRGHVFADAVKQLKEDIHA
ncbi:MAG: UDP-N-acetylmuramoyl-L-alanine--D-glutamate ligase [Proteobacteria bacterium]|nr:UDP-N-acetylmuramoyl-L-alanine--D-glutamate ligase [Pseudomonadota bacterium]